MSIWRSPPTRWASPIPRGLWRDVNPALPAIPIQVMGPPATSGTRDALVELMMEPGCAGATRKPRPSRPPRTLRKYDSRCKRIRDDGPYIDKGENDNLIVQGLPPTPMPSACSAIRISRRISTGCTACRSRASRRAMRRSPTAAIRARGRCSSTSRSAICAQCRGCADFLTLYTTMWNPKGKLVKRGLIAAPDALRMHSAQIVAASCIALDPAGLH
jgi:phosphate transport system substrate-binding protein